MERGEVEIERLETFIAAHTGARVRAR